MVAEPTSSRKRSDEELAKIANMVVQGLLPQLQKPNSDDRKEQKEERNRVVLDEKNSGGWKLLRRCVSIQDVDV
eukprot:3949623-Karenia_brevis.AAC.1